MTHPAKRRVCLTLDADAADLLLDMAGGHERKQGEVASQLIRDRAGYPPLPSHPAAVETWTWLGRLLGWFDKQG